MAPVDVTGEAVKAAPGVVGALVALRWMPGTPLQRLSSFVGGSGDKSLYVWWQETDAISRGDANWQQIEAAVPWGKVSASDLFDLAAQV